VHRTEYFYSGDHFLARKIVYENGTTISDERFIRDGLLAVQERDGSNNMVREYLWGLNVGGGGIGGLLKLKQGGQNYSYVYDGKGNVTALLDPGQAVVAVYTYDAFGILMSQTGSLDQPFKFSTKAYDGNTGLSYYGYRFYLPAQGRWMTRDPLGEAGGLNLYGFVTGDPVNRVDPMGLEVTWEDITDVLRAIWEGIKGAGAAGTGELGSVCEMAPQTYEMVETFEDANKKVKSMCEDPAMKNWPLCKQGGYRYRGLKE